MATTTDVPAADCPATSERPLDLETAPSLRQDRTIAIALFFGVLAIYVAVTPGTVYAYDANAMFAVTKNIVDHGSLRTTGTGFVDSFRQSTPYSPYGIAVSVLAVPAYALSKVIGNEMLLVSMVNPILMALAVVVVFWIARALGWHRIHGLVAAVGFGICTMALQSTTELFSEPGVTLCVVVMVLAIIRWGQGWRFAPLWLGLASAAAIQFRSDSIITVWIGLLALPLFVPWSQLWNRRALLFAGIPMVLSVAFLLWYNDLRFHKFVVSAYGQGGGFTTPLLGGLHGFLLDPGKSIFLFNPLLILGAVGVVALFFRNRPVAALFVLLIVPRLLFFSKWSSWGGGWCWGPRFLLPAVPLLVLAAVELLRVFDRRSVAGIFVRATALVLAIVSLGINYLSVRVPYEQWLGVLATPSTLARIGMPSLSVGAQATDYYDRFSTGPIWGDVILLRHHLAIMSPDWWVHGHSAAVGIALLVFGLGCLGYATRTALGSTVSPLSHDEASPPTGPN